MALHILARSDPRHPFYAEVLNFANFASFCLKVSSLYGLLFRDLVVWWSSCFSRSAKAQTRLTIHRQLLVFSIRYLSFPSTGQLLAINSYERIRWACP